MLYHKTRERMKRRLAYWVTGPRISGPRPQVMSEAEQERRDRNLEHQCEQARVLATLPEHWRKFYKP